MSVFLGIKFHKNLELRVFSILPEFNSLKIEKIKYLQCGKFNKAVVKVEQEMSAVVITTYPEILGICVRYLYVVRHMWM